MPQKVQRIGRYEVRRRLGEGAFGVVFHAWDPQLQCDVAIKVCKASATRNSSRESVARFYREARVAAKLSHPNILPVKDMGQIQQKGQTQPYIVMPLINGPSLERLIDQGHRFGEQDIQQLISGMAAGLHHAHQHGLVHRDVKPANVLLTTEGNPLLADFGMVFVSEGTGGLSQDGQTLGTPAYMAPEQIHSSRGEVDGRADIYSLGVILYELLCGQRPYEGPAMNVLFHVAQGTQFPRPSEIRSNVHPVWEAICLKAMAHQREHRFASAEDMLAAMGLQPGAGSQAIMPLLVSAGNDTTSNADLSRPTAKPHASSAATSAQATKTQSLGVTATLQDPALPPRSLTMEPAAAKGWGKVLILGGLCLGILVASWAALQSMSATDKPHQNATSPTQTPGDESVDPNVASGEQKELVGRWLVTLGKSNGPQVVNEYRPNGEIWAKFVRAGEKGKGKEMLGKPGQVIGTWKRIGPALFSVIDSSGQRGLILAVNSDGSRLRGSNRERTRTVTGVRIGDLQDD